MKISIVVAVVVVLLFSFLKVILLVFCYDLSFFCSNFTFCVFFSLSFVRIFVFTNAEIYDDVKKCCSFVLMVTSSLTDALLHMNPIYFILMSPGQQPQ
jgi:hypothetical protein